MNKQITLNELERIEKISKISKIGVYFYIPKGKPTAYAFTKDNGSLQEIISGSIGAFDRDIYISNDDIKRMIKEAKQGNPMFSYYNWYYEINKHFSPASQTIQNFLMVNQLVYKKEDYNKSEEWLDLYKTKADEGARRLTFESNDYGAFLTKSMMPANKTDRIDVHIYHLDTMNLARIFIYKSASNILIENFMFI